MLESKFRVELIRELRNMFPYCMIVFNNPHDIQGFPDITILIGDRWAMLECKASLNSPIRPNQEYYIELANKMSFARFIYPENKEIVLNELYEAFRSDRSTRFP